MRKQTVLLLSFLLLLTALTPLGVGAEGENTESKSIVIEDIQAAAPTDLLGASATVTPQSVTVELSETETVIVGRKADGSDADYGWSACVACGKDASFFGAEDTYGGMNYKVQNRFVAFEVNAPVSGTYKLETSMRGGAGNITVYLDEISLGAHNVPATWGNNVVSELTTLSMSKGKHMVLIYVPNTVTKFVQDFRFTKVGTLESIDFRAANFDSASGTSMNIYNRVDGKALKPADRTEKYGEESLLNTYEVLDKYGKETMAVHDANLTFNFNIPTAGVWKLSGVLSGTAVALNVTVGSETTPQIDRTITAEGYQSIDPIGYLTLPAGDVSITVSAVKTTLSLSTLRLEYMAPVEISKVSAGGSALSEGDTVARGTDRLTITATREMNTDTLSGVTLKKDGTAVSAKISSENKNIYVDLLETLDYNASYTLSWSGLKCVAGTVAADGSLSFTAGGAEGDKGTASIEKDAEKCDVKDREATIVATMKSSAKQGISGRTYSVSKLVKPDKTEVTEGLPSGVSGKDGAVSVSYTFPNNETEYPSGVYSFVLSGEYGATETVELLYVTQGDKIRILNGLKDTKSATDVQTHLENADNAKALAIDPTNDLKAFSDKSAFYAHFIGANYSDIATFKTAYQTMIALENINQAANAAAVEAVLGDNEQTSLLGIDTGKFALLTAQKDAFLADLFAAERCETTTDFVKLYDKLCDKYLLLEYRATTPGLVLSASGVKVGQDIVIDTAFDQETANIKELTLFVSDKNNSLSDEDVSFDSDIRATVSKSEENGVVILKLSAREAMTAEDIGAISITSSYSAGDTAEFSVKAELVYDLDIAYNPNYEAAEKSVSVSVSKSSGVSGGSTGSSSRGNSYGGGTAVNPVPTEPSDDNKTDTPSDTPSENKPENKTPFGDLKGVEWAQESINKLYLAGIINGDGDNFAPNRSVSRAEFVKMLVNSLGLLQNDLTVDYQDLSKDSWEYRFVASAAAAGLITGDENACFNGNGEISREDMCVMLYRAWKLKKGESTAESESFADDAAISAYAAEAVYAMRAAGIVSGVGENNFAPKQTATRAMAAKVIAGFMEGMNL